MISVESPSPSLATGREVPSVSEHDQPDFVPPEPASLEESGLNAMEVESLVLKLLLNSGAASGRNISAHIRLPFIVVQSVLDQLKAELFVSYRNAAPMNDYIYELTEEGLRRARRRAERCTYFGAAPVRLSDYVESVKLQSIELARPRLHHLQAAFQDLQLSPPVMSQIGQAVNSGRAMFLYGAPGNGKTSIAERVIRSVSASIWIPRCITITDEIIRIYDPTCHEEVPVDEHDQLLKSSHIDQRWVRIKRPTVVAGGELTMEMLECIMNPATGINEAPLQLKSNGGALVIDDFGRQRISTTELLNRWIVPLEKGYDYLTLPSGRHIQIPFAQLLVFSTNLDPRKIVDEAFLRRIPYKIEVFDPSEEEFRSLFERTAQKFGFRYAPDVVDYLLKKHFRDKQRPLRFCHTRDIILQLKNLCEFHELPLQISEQSLDVAVYNYFAGL